MTSVSRKAWTISKRSAKKGQTITSHFASFQAQWLNVHVDFPLTVRWAVRASRDAMRSAWI
jgi:hypothetical protein